MKAQLNFYDEKVIVVLQHEFTTFKNIISKSYAMEYSDVEELIMNYVDYDNRRKNMTNQKEYEQMMAYSGKFYSENRKILDIFLEVSEFSKLFQREMENSRVLPLEIDEKERLRNEIMLKEQKLKEMLILERETMIKKELERVERERRQAQEVEEKRRLEERERIEREMREAQDAEERRRFEEEEKRRVDEEEKRRFEEEEKRRVDEEEKRRLEHETALKIQRVEDEKAKREEREAFLREKLKEIREKIEKEKLKIQEKSVEKEENKNIENDNKNLKQDEKDILETNQVNVDSNKDQKKIKKEAKKYEKENKKIEKKIKKSEKKEKKDKNKDKIEIKENEIDPDFSIALSKVINDKLETAKGGILKKSIKEAFRMLEKYKKGNLEQSMFSTSNVIHSRVRCDGCGVNPIVGNRYKCTICEDFDYCDACEEINSENHKHPFLKIRKPEMAPIKILCAINESIPDYQRDENKEKELKNLDNENANEIISDQKEITKESPKGKGFLNKLKNEITQGLKNIPKKIIKVEGKILDKVQNFINSQSDDRTKYANLIPVVRQNYLLENITDDQLLEALIRSKGNVDDAVCCLFSDN